MTVAYNEGQQAFYNDEGLIDNPYREGTIYFQEWSRGYVDADLQESGDQG